MCLDIEGVEDRRQEPGQSREAHPKLETGLLALGQWEMAEF